MLVQLAIGVLKLISLTLRVRLYDPHGLAPQRQGSERLIYAFWHNQQLLGAAYFRGFGIRVLVSRSKDGDYITQALEAFGFRTVRASTSSGRTTALRGLARELAQGHSVAITPDGPRGPVYQAQPGAVFLAALSGQAIAPLGCAVQRAWVLRSWDRFVIPQPFSRVAIVYGQRLKVPRRLDAANSADYTRRLQDQLRTLDAEAQRRLTLPEEKA